MADLSSYVRQPNGKYKSIYSGSEYTLAEIEGGFLPGGTTPVAGVATSPAAPTAPTTTTSPIPPAPTDPTVTTPPPTAAGPDRSAGAITHIRYLFPFLPEPLLNTLLEAYVDSGDVDLAVAEMRASGQYDTFFQGNRRADGTLRFTESEYASYKDYYRATLASVNVNPDLFMGRFAEVVEGDVSPSEFAARVDSIYERVVSQAPAMRQFYANEAGSRGIALDPMSDSALLASVLDPAVGEQIINRRISMAEVGGEAALRGFGLDLGMANQLVQQGLGRAEAQQLFGEAASSLPILDVLARRHNDPDDDFDLNEFVAASIFDDQGERQRMRRLVAQERGLYTSGAFNRGREGEVLGLLQR